MICCEESANKKNSQIVQRLPLNHMPKKPWKLSLVAVDQWGDPALNERKVYRNVLPDFSGVTTYR